MSTIRFMLIAMVLCTAPAMLYAQQSDIETLLRGCISIEDDGQRLSCYDKYMRPNHVGSSGELSATTEPGGKPEAVETSPSQVEVTKPSIAAESSVEAVSSEVVGSKETADRTEVEQLAVEEFGLKQEQPRDVNVTVTVKGIRKNLNNRFVYTTTDGQVWVQIDRRGVHYDEVPFVAEIRTASLGSFFLKPKSNGVSVRVRREK